jgi:membrane protease YdiL (CAAX protease family)
MFDKKVRHIMISTLDRKRIFIFTGIAYGISIALALLTYWDGGIFISYPMKMRSQAYILMTVWMFAPMVAHIATRLITREGRSNTLLRPNFRRGWRFYLAALCLPALAIIVGATIYYLLFPSRFDVTMTYARDTLGLVPMVGSTDLWTFLITQTPLTIVLSLLTLPLMFGEEFGWRAYLLPKLMPLGARKAVLLVGVIHGAWHWPFFLMGYTYGFDYWGAPVVGMLLYLVMVCFISVFMAWVTLRSGSVWPAALAHGVINASANWTLVFISGAPEPLIGPQPVGVIGSLGFALLALLIFFSPRALAQPASAPVDMAVSKNSRAVEKAAEQAIPGTAS